MNLRRTFILPFLIALPWVGRLAASPATQPAPTSPGEQTLSLPTTQPIAGEAVDPNDHMLLLQAPRIEQVAKLSLENKLLRMNTDLPLILEPARIRIPNLPGKTVAIVQGVDGGLTPRISIRHEVPPIAGRTVIYTLWSALNDVRLSVDSEDARQLRSVQYIQTTVSPECPDPDEKAVRLYVHVTDMTTNTKLVDLKLTADNVIELRQKYPREMADYFQPLLAVLGQETVAFEVDHRTAWQVLAKHWSPDPKVEEQVKQTIHKLDADDFAVREAASDTLEKIGEPAALTVLRMQRDHLSSEQNSRLDAFLAPYRPLPDAEAKRLANDVSFLIDCLYTEDPTMRQTVLRQLQAVTGKAIDVKSQPSRPAWVATVRQLRKDLLPATPTTQPVLLPAKLME